jgi:hypothetical protein
VHAAVAEPVEQSLVAPSRARDGDAPVGLGLGQVEHLCAIGEHRREGVPAEESALLDLSDVRDEVGLDAAVLGDELGEPVDQHVVGNGTKRIEVSDLVEGLGFHAINIGSVFRASQERD